MHDHLTGHVVGVEVTLKLGEPLTSAKGRLMHPLLRATRIFRHLTPVTNLGVGSILSLALLAGWSAGGADESFLSRFYDRFVASQSAEDKSLASKNVNDSPARVVNSGTSPAAYEQGSDPATVKLNAPEVSSRHPAGAPLPPGGVIAYPLPQGATFAGPTPFATRPTDGSSITPPHAATQPKTNAQTSKKVDESNTRQASMLITDHSAKIGGGLVVPAASVDRPENSVSNTAHQLDSKSAVVEVTEPTLAPVGPPQTKLPELGMIALVDDASPKKLPASKIQSVMANSSAKAESTEARPEKPKTVVERPAKVKQAGAVESSSRKKEVNAVGEMPATQSRTQAKRLYDDDDSGFARPIRERVVGGGQSAQNAPSNPSTTNSRSSSQRVEVLDVNAQGAIVTDPRTNLPVQVRVGGRLPNGQVLLSVNPSAGSISTNDGPIRME